MTVKEFKIVIINVVVQYDGSTDVGGEVQSRVMWVQGSVYRGVWVRWETVSAFTWGGFEVAIEKGAFLSFGEVSGGHNHYYLYSVHVFFDSYAVRVARVVDETARVAMPASV